MIESLEIDPLDSNHWLYGTGMTIFGGHDLTSWDTIHNVTIQSLANGIEEFSIQGLASAPGGSELLVALGDENGYTFTSQNNLGTSPQTVWSTPTWTTSTGVDYAGNSVKNVVRVGNTAGTQQVAISSDGGVTWNINYGADTSMNGGTVAYSANADTILWSTASSGVQRSQYQSSFTTVSSLPSGAVIASDKKTNTIFYAGSGSTFYISNNTGSSFTPGPKLGSATVIQDIIAHPITAGTIFVSTNAGIFRSTDSGTTFTLVSTALTNTYQIALGVGSGSNWNLYAFGTGSAGARLYASGDNGATWTDIQGSTQGFGAIDSAKLAGSASTAGQVYVGTNGRGVLYAQGTISGGTSGSSSSSSSSKATSSSSSSKASTTTTVRSTLTSSITSTTRASTATRTSSAAGPTGTGLAQHFAQCGGIGWAGPTQCVSPYTCQEQNDCK
jgi:xyloglucan-specific exo-beta-1,4-glucanase